MMLVLGRKNAKYCNFVEVSAANHSHIPLRSVNANRSLCEEKTRKNNPLETCLGHKRKLNDWNLPSQNSRRQVFYPRGFAQYEIQWQSIGLTVQIRIGSPN